MGFKEEVNPLLQNLGPGETLGEDMRQIERVLGGGGAWRVFTLDDGTRSLVCDDKLLRSWVGMDLIDEGNFSIAKDGDSRLHELRSPGDMSLIKANMIRPFEDVNDLISFVIALSRSLARTNSRQSCDKIEGGVGSYLLANDDWNTLVNALYVEKCSILLPIARRRQGPKVSPKRMVGRMIFGHYAPYDDEEAWDSYYGPFKLKDVEKIVDGYAPSLKSLEVQETPHLGPVAKLDFSWDDSWWEDESTFLSADDGFTQPNRESEPGKEEIKGFDSQEANDRINLIGVDPRETSFAMASLGAKEDPEARVAKFNRDFAKALLDNRLKKKGDFMMPGMPMLSLEINDIFVYPMFRYEHAGFDKELDNLPQNMIFIGDPNDGKDELAEAITDYLSDTNSVSLDCSLYMSLEPEELAEKVGEVVGELVETCEEEGVTAIVVWRNFEKLFEYAHDADGKIDAGRGGAVEQIMWLISDAWCDGLVSVALCSDYQVAQNPLYKADAFGMVRKIGQLNIADATDYFQRTLSSYRLEHGVTFDDLGELLKNSWFCDVAKFTLLLINGFEQSGANLISWDHVNKAYAQTFG